MSSLNISYLQSCIFTSEQILRSLQQLITKSFVPFEFLHLLRNAQQLLGNMEKYVRIGLATITHMPSTLILSIFRFLPPSESKLTELVCKMWYQVWKLPIARHFVTKSILDPIGIWLDKPVYTWKLLYKWTQHPRTDVAWHQQCNGKGPTVTVVTTHDGHVFGGYCDLPWWTSTPHLSLGRLDYKASTKSFIFSLTDGKGRQPYQCSQYRSGGFAVCVSRHESGFAWGLGPDLYLNPENMSLSSSYLHTYSLPEGFTGRKTFLASSFTNWEIEEMETYLV